MAKVEPTYTDVKEGYNKITKKQRELRLDEKKSAEQEEARTKRSENVEKRRKALLERLQAQTPNDVGAIVDSMYQKAALFMQFIAAANPIWGKLFSKLKFNPLTLKLRALPTPEEMSKQVTKCEIDNQGILAYTFTLNEKIVDPQSDHYKHFESLLHGFLTSRGYDVEQLPNGTFQLTDPTTVRPYNVVTPEQLRDIMGPDNKELKDFYQSIQEDKAPPPRLAP